MFNINLANDWIRTVDLWYWKQPLYQLIHNHCPMSLQMFPVPDFMDKLSCSVNKHCFNLTI